MNKLTLLIRKNLSSMVDGIKLPFQLIKFFRLNTSVEYKKIALNVFLGKYINMIVMFMPLKLLFVLSGKKNISVLAELEKSVGRDVYLLAMFSILIILYIGNVGLQMYKAKLVERQKQGISDKNYEFLGKNIPVKSIHTSYGPFCQAIADIMVITVVFALLLYANYLFALFYFIILFLFSIIYEQWVFSSHETNLMKFLDIDKKIFLKSVSMIMYLVLFLGIIVLVLNTNTHVIKAILLLLLVRMSNGSFKSYLSCHMKLRATFLG